MKPIASADNPNFKRWLRLTRAPREIHAQQRTLAEGVHLAEAIHAAGHPVEAVLLRRGAKRDDVQRWAESFVAGGAAAYELAANLFDRLAPVEHGSGLLLLIPLPQATRFSARDTLFLEGIQDPGNAGALLRVAAAAGVRDVIASPGTVALWSPKVLRGAQGAHFRLNIHEDVAPDTLRAALPLTWVGAAAHRGTPLWDAQLTEEALGFMVGAEGAGLSPGAMAACDVTITIPLAGGVESLNVAAAAAVCLFERRRQLLALRASPNSSA